MDRGRERAFTHSPSAEKRAALKALVPISIASIIRASLPLFGLSFYSGFLAPLLKHRSTRKTVTIQSPAGDSVGNFVAAIGGMKGLLARKVL
jgi:hypothetical protein